MESLVHIELRQPRSGQRRRTRVGSLKVIEPALAKAASRGYSDDRSGQVKQGTGTSHGRDL
jgi:hypothetical protein